MKKYLSFLFILALATGCTTPNNNVSAENITNAAEISESNVAENVETNIEAEVETNAENVTKVSTASTLDFTVINKQFLEAIKTIENDHITYVQMVDMDRDGVNELVAVTTDKKEPSSCEYLKIHVFKFKEGAVQKTLEYITPTDQANSLELVDMDTHYVFKIENFYEGFGNSTTTNTILDLNGVIVKYEDHIVETRMSSPESEHTFVVYNEYQDAYYKTLSIDNNAVGLSYFEQVTNKFKYGNGISLASGYGYVWECNNTYEMSKNLLGIKSNLYAETSSATIQNLPYTGDIFASNLTPEMARNYADIIDKKTYEAIKTYDGYVPRTSTKVALFDAGNGIPALWISGYNEVSYGYADYEKEYVFSNEVWFWDGREAVRHPDYDIATGSLYQTSDAVHIINEVIAGDFAETRFETAYKVNNGIIELLPYKNLISVSAQNQAITSFTQLAEFAYLMEGSYKYKLLAENLLNIDGSYLNKNNLNYEEYYFEGGGIYIYNSEIVRSNSIIKLYNAYSESTSNANPLLSTKGTSAYAVVENEGLVGNWKNSSDTSFTLRNYANLKAQGK